MWRIQSRRGAAYCADAVEAGSPGIKRIRMLRLAQTAAKSSRTEQHHDVNLAGRHSSKAKSQGAEMQSGGALQVPLDCSRCTSELRMARNLPDVCSDGAIA